MQKREFLKLLGTAGIGAAAGALAGKNNSSDSVAFQKSDQAFERVLQTGKMRCGYLAYAPHFIKDPNTGKFSGIFHDLMQEVGRNLNLQIEWVEEGASDVLVPGLQTQRIDAIASGWWGSGPRGKVMNSGKPVFFNALGVYVRKDEKRFANLDDLNQSGVRIAVLDGAMASEIADHDFPKAQKKSLPALSDLPMLLNEVAHGKADFTISATHEFAGFDKHNPGLLKRLDVKLPIRVFPNVLFFNKGENKLQTMLDASLDELYYAGVVNKLVDQYEPFPGSFYRVAQPYAAAHG